MKTLKIKLKKQGGFTLVEMLTVVAIIAILIAISIPMVTGALDRAKKATDAANIRAAKAAMSIKALTDTTYNEGTALFYDAAKGSLETTAPSATYKQDGDTNTNKFIVVVVVDDVVYYQWADAKSDVTITDGHPANNWNDAGNWLTEVPNPDAPDTP